MATIRRGGSALLDLRVGPKHEDDPHVEQWRFGNRRTYPRVPPVWPLADADPWQQASYSGPLPAAAESDTQPACPSCGSAQAVQAHYCGQCGSALDAVEALAAALAARIGDTAAGSPTAGAALAALIERYTQESAGFSRGRTELLQFIEADFTASASARFIRGEPARISSGLTLAIAQDIHQTVAATGRVRPEQIPHAELLLRFAPLQFGYWGPFKALIKTVPVDDMPDAYADALARLSSKDWSRPAPESVQIEDTSFLGDLFPAASPRTLKYLARRARRDLATLANRSPDTYARVAARMILSWDQRLSRNAFAPAYVMLGARSPLDAHSENVALDPAMSSRRDAHPAIWNARPELAQEIFDGITTSPEAQTWSFQVLEEVGQAPQISGDHLKLALLSAYPPLTLAACAALAKRPGLWGSLTEAQWAAFFRYGDDASIDGILDAMSVGKARPAAAEAAREFLASGAPGTPRRMLRISLLFLAATQTSANTRTIVDPQADVAAVAAVITQSGTHHQKIWSPVIEGLDIEHLGRLRHALPGDTPSMVLGEIDELLFRKRAQLADPSDPITWIASANASDSEFGWQILDRGYGMAGLVERLPHWISRRLPDPATVERIIPEVLARATRNDAPQVAKALQEALKRGVGAANLLALVAETPLGPSVIWDVIASPDTHDFATLVVAAPDLFRLTGDEVRPDQLALATAEQCRFVQSYIMETPSRIARDVAFGLAAATSAEPALQLQSIRHLQENGHMPEVWLTLAQSEVSNARAAARDYVAGLDDGRKFRDAVLACLDSGSPLACDIGLELLRQRLEHSEDRSFWTALAESEDPRLEGLVAELVAAEARIADRVDELVLSGFDRRVLVGRRRYSRTAKELVKARLDATHVDSGLATEDRIAALLALARGQTLKDKEWALEKLAELALNGVAIEGLEVSLVTKGDGS